MATRSSNYRRPEAMPRVRARLARDEGAIDGAFRAVADATEEAILNALCRAKRMVGRDGHVREALPLDRVVEILSRRGRPRAAL